MGTVSDKLTYLNTTKGKIKDAINLTNANILSEDTFRSYADKLKQGLVDAINDGGSTIYSNFPKTTQTDTEIALNDTYEAPMTIALKGNTEQDSYTGKNLLYLLNGSKTNNGITGVWNNGILSYSGKATNTYAGITDFTNTVLTPGTYTFSIDHSINVQVRFRYLSNTDNDAVIQPGDTSKTFTLTENSVRMYVFLNNLTVDTQYSGTIKIQLEKSSIATSYEPYCGGIPSPNPDYPQEVKVVTGNNTINVHGKNLFDKDNANIIDNKYLNASGVEVNDNAFAISDYIQIQSNQTYSLTPRINVGACLCYYDTNKNFISSVSLSNINNTFVTPANSCYIKASFKKDVANSIQIELGSQATTYEPYQSQDYEIDLGNIELCKIEDYKDVIFKNNQLSEYYDSTLDEDSWYIKKNIGKVVLDGSENWNTRAGGTLYAYQLFNVFDGNKTNGLSTHWKFISGGATNSQTEECIASANTNISLSVFTNNSNLSTLTNFTTWLSSNNMTLYYVLSTPTNTEITDTDLIEQLEDLKTAKSVEGQTNITQVNEELPFILDVSGLKKD